MKRALTFAATILVAAPLFAADQNKPKTEKKADSAPAAAPAIALATAPASQPVLATDSPLVAAAKRTNRLGKKPSHVITNENLVTTGGHFTTTTKQGTITTPGAKAVDDDTPAPAPKAKSADAAAKPVDAAAKAKVAREAQARYDNTSLSDDNDPARLEHQLQQAADPQAMPPAPGDKKPQ
jgi:hypothetical protein